VASGEVETRGKQHTGEKEPKPKTKRVASEKMKAALLRARLAKAEKRRSRAKQPTSNLDSRPQPQFFFDIV
jgi:hypothetical protein